MSEFETNVLDVLERISAQQALHGEALLTLSKHQEATSTQVVGLHTTMGQILTALSKEPNGDSITTTLETLLKPLVAGLADLSARLPPLSNK